MGHTCDCLYHLGDVIDSPGHHETQDRGDVTPPSPRSVRFQRCAVYCVQLWASLRLHGSLHHLLLCPIIRASRRWSWICAGALHSRHCQREFLLWPHHPWLLRGQGRLNKCPNDCCIHKCIANILPDCHQEHARSDSLYCAVWLFLQELSWDSLAPAWLGSLPTVVKSAFDSE